MNFGDSEIIKEKGEIRILKIGARYEREVFCVIGNGNTKHYNDYEDALEEFNLRWVKIKFGE